MGDGQPSVNVNSKLRMRHLDSDMAVVPCILMKCNCNIVRVKYGRKRPQSEQVGGQLWKDRRLSDCVFVCDGHRFPVHKAVVCGASEAFRAALTGTMKEAEEEVFEIRQTIPAAVDHLLRYIYTRDLTVQLDMTSGINLTDLLTSLLELAMQYEIYECAELVAEHLLEYSNENMRQRLDALRRH